MSPRPKWYVLSLILARGAHRWLRTLFVALLTVGPRSATITVPASLSSATGDDLIVGVTINTPTEKKEGSDSVEPEDSANPAPPTPTTTTGGTAANGTAQDGSNVVKANKGMILRKSVEYIRYLQQLVSAQATRNRDLEQQLQAFRNGQTPPASSPSAGADGEAEMKLHDEVDAFGLLNGNATGEGVNGGSSAPPVNGRARRGSIRTSFHLPSVEEMEQDTEHPDQEMERPSTSGTGVSPGSSMDDDLDDEEGEEGEDYADEDMEIERGRKGRDGRPVGKRVGRKGKSISVGADVKVKKESDRMEVS